ncbi:MAG: c-type cytochrome [Alphaproteobacteria bacterium]|nr:c-type cytochrome [Alphaproteobacteria bacterium]
MARRPRPSALLALAALLSSVAASAIAQEDGERIFQRCFSCHSVDPAEQNLSGPNLHGVVGRRAATLPEFEYSDAMRAAGGAGLVWTPEILDRYLADPEDFLPEGRMAGVRLRDPAQRRVLIEWLAGRSR